MRILFFMRAMNYSRHFESYLRVAVRYGHQVHVALDVEKKHGADDPALLEDIDGGTGRLTWGLAPTPERPAWSDFAIELRTGIDWLRYSDPPFEAAHGLRRRAEERAPRLVQRAAAVPPFRGARGRSILDRGLRRLEAALPPRPEVESFIREHDPHLVAVSPLVGFGSPQGDYLRSAKTLGIPTAVLVASWDNLTNKGVIRDDANVTLVWNEAQRREAIDLHGLDPASVSVTGAHTYDHWFGWQPRTSREQFCARVGLTPDRPFLLYTCSSGFIAPDEPAFVDRWIAALRSSSDERLRAAGVLVRPHPAYARVWERWRPREAANVALWPRQGASPTDVERKAEYFDSIHHSSLVVGINTSAMVESAIVGRGVFTVLAPDFAETQEGTLHFAHLTQGGDGGLVRVARDLDEHLAQLGEAFDAPAPLEERARRFVSTFVRPCGREIPAGRLAVESLEQIAATADRTPVRPRRRDAVLRLAMAPAAFARPYATRLARWLAVRSGRPDRPPRPVGDARRILFVLDHPGLMIHFDQTIRSLAGEGHVCLLAFSRPERFAQGMDALGPRHSRIVEVKSPVGRQDAFKRIAKQIRLLTDYVHYLHPRLRRARYSRDKVRHAGLPAVAFLLKRVETLPRPVASAALRTLSALESAIPSDLATEARLEAARPDLVVVSPLILRDGYQTDVVKSARRLGIPSAVCVASWDNLSSKGRMRVIPDRVVVWNEAQAREARELHDVPSDRLIHTGAQQFDRWFDREPGKSAEEVRRVFGLPVDRPYVLFVGSTRQKLDENQEIDFARRWIEALRSSDDEEIRGVGVLIRPHFVTAELWRKGSFEMPDVAIWHRDDPLPVRETERSAYYDALFHSAAIIGINSSAMIEAAIIGRPVHTVCEPQFHEMQHALLHYHYLRASNGGFLREAVDLDEHVRLLAADLRDGSDARRAQQAFVSSFIRPHGANKPALPILRQALVSCTEVAPATAPRRRASLAIARGVLVPLVAQDRARIGVVRLFSRSAYALGGILVRMAARLSPEQGGKTGILYRARARAAGLLERLSSAVLAVGRLARQYLKSQREALPELSKRKPDPALKAAKVTKPKKVAAAPKKTARERKAERVEALGEAKPPKKPTGPGAKAVAKKAAKTQRSQKRDRVP